MENTSLKYKNGGQKPPNIFILSHFGNHVYSQNIQLFPFTFMEYPILKNAIFLFIMKIQKIMIMFILIKVVLRLLFLIFRILQLIVIRL